MKGFVGLEALFAIIFVLLAAAGGTTYYLAHQAPAQPQEPADHSTDAMPNLATTPAQDASVKTYTNSQYGFSLQYQADLSPENPPTAGRELFGSWKPVFSLASLSGTRGYESMKVVVLVNTDPSIVSNCVTPPRGDPEHSAPSTSIVYIGGVPFITYESGDAGLGQFIGWQVYQASSKDVCYSLELVRSGVASSHLDAAGQAQFSEDDQQMNAKLMPVIQSFKILNEVMTPIGDSGGPASGCYYKGNGGEVFLKSQGKPPQTYTQIKGADLASFRNMVIYGICFAKDKNHVYQNAAVLTAFDPATFNLLWYAKPGPVLFYQNKSLIYAFSYSNPFFLGMALVPEGDAATFEMLNGGTDFAPWAKDKNNVYCGGAVLAGADPTTAHTTGPFALQVTISGTKYSVDGNCNETILPNQ